MDEATLRALLTGFGGGLVGALIGGLVLFGSCSTTTNPSG